MYIETKKGRYFMEKWLGVQFESSSVLTKQFSSFARQFRTELIKKTKEDFKLLDFNREHFYCSGFMQHIESGKIVYFSISDTRHWQDEWYNNILIRIARDTRDFTGGRNNHTSFNKINEDMVKLVERELR